MLNNGNGNPSVQSHTLDMFFVFQVILLYIRLLCDKSPMLLGKDGETSPSSGSQLVTISTVASSLPVFIHMHTVHNMYIICIYWLSAISSFLMVSIGKHSQLVHGDCGAILSPPTQTLSSSFWCVNLATNRPWIPYNHHYFWWNIP